VSKKFKVELGDGKKLDTYSVHSACDLIKRGDLVLDPAYQTGARWKNSQKANLIDSLIHGLDLPKLYFRTVQAGADEKHEVVDGQQRLRSISEFIDNKFRLTSGQYKGKTFNQLPQQIRRKIQDFELHAIVLTGKRWTDDVIRDLFLRLQMGTPLNPAEKRRALPGEFPIVVASLARHKLFSANTSISKSRYGHEDAVAKILHLVLSNGRPKISAGAIRQTYLDHQAIKATTPQVVAVKNALEYLSKALKDTGQYFRKFNILSVVTALVDLTEEYSITGKHKEVGVLLWEIENRRTANALLAPADPSRDPSLTKLTETSRSDRTDHLEWRKDFYASEIIKLGFARRDKKRAFTSLERGILMCWQGGRCNLCKKSITAKTSHVDHVVPHSRGGTTTLQNAQLLCVPCNTSKGAKV
jgi:hypothetical protein